MDEAVSLNPQDEITEEIIESAEESETSQPDEVEELRKRAALADDYKKRAEIAEREAKKLQKKDVHSNDDLTTKDVYALMNAKVPEEDIEQVAEYAKFKKITVAEALKSSIVKTMLEESQEQRRTANATQTRGGARGTSKVSGEELLAKAERTGEVPETDEGMRELFNARLMRRVPKKL